jgi:hypothetical protein
VTTVEPTAVVRPQPRAVAWLQLRGVAWPVVGGLSAVAAVAGAGGIAGRGSAPALLPIAFALLAAAAAFLLDEPASEVVDVTPTGPAHRAAVRALALLVPLAVGSGLVLAFALRQPRPSWPAVTLTLAGNVLLGFAIACVARRRTGEPGPLAAAVVVAVLVVPGLLPPVARWVHTFPAATPDPTGLPATACWWIIGAVCAVAVPASLTSWPGRASTRSAHSLHTASMHHPQRSPDD